GAAAERAVTDAGRFFIAPSRPARSHGRGAAVRLGRARLTGANQPNHPFGPVRRGCAADLHPARPGAYGAQAAQQPHAEVFGQPAPLRSIPVRAVPMRILRRLRKHSVLIVLTATALVPAALGLYWWFWPSVPTLLADEVRSIEVHLLPFTKGYDADSRQEEARVITTDPAQI